MLYLDAYSSITFLQYYHFYVCVEGVRYVYVCVCSSRVEQMWPPPFDF